MGLDARGDIAAAQLAVYIPVLAISVFLVSRHGFGRRAGWLFLLILSISQFISVIGLLFRI